MRSRSCTAWILSLALLGWFATVRLAAQSATATISGTVTDASGAVIPDAVLRATNRGTGASQAANSDSQGRYRIPELAVGEYDIQSEKMGFQTLVKKGITLTVG